MPRASAACLDTREICVQRVIFYYKAEKNKTIFSLAESQVGWFRTTIMTCGIFLSLYWKLSSCLCFSEIEAKEACDWLKAAGFPQYAQMFEGTVAHIILITRNSWQIFNNKFFPFVINSMQKYGCPEQSQWCVTMNVSSFKSRQLMYKSHWNTERNLWSQVPFGHG